MVAGTGRICESPRKLATDGRKTIRVPLEALKAVYEGPGKISPRGERLPRDEDGLWGLESTLALLSGIRITAEKEPTEVLDYLNTVKTKFTVRGRIRSQMRWLFGNMHPAMGRRVIYASHGYATHRVLVYRFFGKLIREYSYEDADGTIQSLSAFEAKSYQMFPLARVDVLPPLRYLASKYPVLEDYRDAVLRSAERIACAWYARMSASLGYDPNDMSSSGWGASVICRLSRKDLKTVPSRVWSNMKQPKGIGTEGARRLQELSVRASQGSATKMSSKGGE